MSNPNSGGQGFFEEHGLLGILGGSILLIAGYTIWRGPHRSFFPTCLTGRLRRNSAIDTDGDEEKRLRGISNRGTRRDRNEPTGRNRSGIRGSEFGRDLGRYDMGTMASGGIGQIGERSQGSWSTTTGGKGMENKEEEILYDHHQPNDISLLQYRNDPPLISPTGLAVPTSKYPSPPSPALMSGTRPQYPRSNSSRNGQKDRAALPSRSAQTSGVQNGDDSDMW